MARASFRFHGSLSSFLKREHRDRAFAHPCARAACRTPRPAASPRRKWGQSPFSVALEPVDAASVAETVPGKVRERQRRFTRCASCGRVYWPGSHYERMRAALGDLLGA